MHYSRKAVFEIVDSERKNLRYRIIIVRIFYTLIFILILSGIPTVNQGSNNIHAEQRHKSSKGKESWSTIFRGLFIVAKFYKNFIGKTVILPDSAQSTFGDLICG